MHVAGFSVLWLWQNKTDRNMYYVAVKNAVRALMLFLLHRGERAGQQNQAVVIISTQTMAAIVYSTTMLRFSVENNSPKFPEI